ncbi:kDa in NOF-FB transposable, partial [Brachionus plicatilis]
SRFFNRLLIIDCQHYSQPDENQKKETLELKGKIEILEGQILILTQKNLTLEEDNAEKLRQLSESNNEIGQMNKNYDDKIEYHLNDYNKKINDLYEKGKKDIEKSRNEHRTALDQISGLKNISDSRYVNAQKVDIKIQPEKLNFQENMNKEFPLYHSKNFTSMYIKRKIIILKIWIQAKCSNPIWYFDATGSVHKNIVSQKKPLLYSIVFSDKKNKIIMPIAEFITTEQTTKSISIYLQSIENKIPPIIVSDFSWAIINSFLSVFNKITIRTYLTWCYGVIFENQKETKNV